MSQAAFTRAEAQAKVGRRVRIHVAFAEVPEGALGSVLRVTCRSTTTPAMAHEQTHGASPDGSTADCRGTARG
jgi:hypothetical protein